MSKSNHYRNAKRVKLAPSYNVSHLNKWQSYAEEMGCSNRATINDVTDFAEVLLGEGKVSVNNYLSTVVNWLVDNDKIVADPFFERKYGRIRHNVKNLL